MADNANDPNAHARQLIKDVLAFGMDGARGRQSFQQGVAMGIFDPALDAEAAAYGASIQLGDISPDYVPRRVRDLLTNRQELDGIVGYGEEDDPHIQRQQFLIDQRRSGSNATMGDVFGDPWGRRRENVQGPVPYNGTGRQRPRQ